jgi:hypothetical protein
MKLSASLAVSIFSLRHRDQSKRHTNQIPTQPTKKSSNTQTTVPFNLINLKLSFLNLIQSRLTCSIAVEFISKLSGKFTKFDR